MIPIMIGRMEYAVPTLWNEINSAQAAAVDDCLSTAQLSPTGIDDLYVGVLAAMCRIERSVARRIDPVDRRYTVDRLIGNRIEQMVTGGGTLHAMESFHWGKRTFVFPPADYDINLDERPLSGMKAGDFCDMSDLFAADRIVYAPILARMLCLRDNGEELTPQQWLQQSAQTLTMDAVREIWGRIASAHTYLRREFGLCYQSATGTIESSPTTDEVWTLEGMVRNRMPRRAIPQVWWSEFLTLTAGCRPADVAAARRMNLYDFFALANTTIKYRQK